MIFASQVSISGPGVHACLNKAPALLWANRFNLPEAKI
jgi:hypothetical protein